MSSFLFSEAFSFHYIFVIVPKMLWNLKSLPRKLCFPVSPQKNCLKIILFHFSLKNLPRKHFFFSFSLGKSPTNFCFFVSAPKNCSENIFPIFLSKIVHETFCFLSYIFSHVFFEKLPENKNCLTFFGTIFSLKIWKSWKTSKKCKKYVKLPTSKATP